MTPAPTVHTHAPARADRGVIKQASSSRQRPPAAAVIATVSWYERLSATQGASGSVARHVSTETFAWDS